MARSYLCLEAQLGLRAGKKLSTKAVSDPKACRRGLLRSTALVGAIVSAVLVVGLAPAFADGGQGGAPAFGGSGGAGGTATAPTGGHGSDEDLITVFGGGGGGGGGVSLSTGAGGAGGTGGTVQSGSGDAPGGDGGRGGNFGLVIPSAPNVTSVSGTVGGTGGNSTTGGGGGGGGGEGGGGVLFTGLAASSNASTIAGGNGGDGGNTGNNLAASGSGGSGGAGGVGVALTSGANFTNNAGAIVQGGTGGTGGAAGYSINDIAGKGGDGGNGGRGVLMVNGGTLTNAGTITGGAAGAGGLGGTGLVNGANGVSGVGGTGVSGANITVVNSGTIAGGSGGGLAIAFTGGTNTLELRAGSTITGNAVAFSSADTLRLGGSTNATFDASTIGAAAQYRGFGTFEKAGASTWTLTGTNAFSGTTIVSGGTLLAGNAGAFSAASAMTINGGTVDLNGFAQTINTVALAGGALNNGSLTGTVTSTGGGIGGVGGSMSLVANAGTTIVFAGNTYTGTTTVNNGAILFTPNDNSFSAASAVTINSGGTFLLTGSLQTVNAVALAGGSLESGNLIGAVTSTGGTLINMFGSMSLTANGGTTTVGGFSSGYTGATTVNNGAILLGGVANGFSAASVTTINTGGTVDLGGFAQTVDNVALAGGLMSNGALTGAVTSTGGTIASIGGGMNLTANGGTTTFFVGNTYTGATTVNNGAILLGGAANGFSAASATTVNTGGTVDLGGFAQTINNVALAGGLLSNGALTGAVTSTGGTIAGIGGAMNLTANGGTTTVTGTNTYSGPTTVNGGLLSVNGSIVSDVTVNAGGTLGGNGTVGNTTINGGALAPGNSIGLLTVQGSLVFTAAANYMVQVSPVNADRTNVTGAATLGGATVNASFAPGTYVAKQYTILNAGGGVQGTFSSLVNTDLPSGFKASLSYDTRDAYLNLALDFVPPPGTGLNANQRNVGNAIVNFFNSSGGIPIVFGALTPAGLTQLSGEAGTGSLQTTFNAMNQFIGVMTDPFVAGRGDTVPAGGTIAGYADEEASAYAPKRRPSDALAAINTKAPPRAATFEQRWSVWAAGFGGSQTTDGNVALGSNSITSSIYGTAVGADYRFSPNTIAGFALAGGGTNFSVANNLGGGRSDLFQAGAFIRHDVGPRRPSRASSPTSRAPTPAKLSHDTSGECLRIICEHSRPVTAPSGEARNPPIPAFDCEGVLSK
jgi:uncharacterized protein with beta-barrel porin domain